jgi:hypothetical protein
MKMDFTHPSDKVDKAREEILRPLKLIRAGWTVTDGSGAHTQILGNAIVRLIQYNRRVVALAQLESTISKSGLKSTIGILKKHGKKNKI